MRLLHTGRFNWLSEILLSLVPNCRTDLASLIVRSLNLPSSHLQLPSTTCTDNDPSSLTSPSYYEVVLPKRRSKKTPRNPLRLPSTQRSPPRSFSRNMYPGPDSRSRNWPHSEKSSVPPQPAPVVYSLPHSLYFLGNCVFGRRLMCLEVECRICRFRVIRGGFSRGIWLIMLLD